MRNPIPSIKRLILRALNKTNRMAIQQSQIDIWCRDGMTPPPLPSDIHQALREMQSEKWIVAAHDKFDESEILWKLTTEGEIEAQQLG